MQVLGVLSDLYLSDLYHSPVRAKISIVTRMGVEPERFFVGTGLICPQEEEKTKKEVLG